MGSEQPKQYLDIHGRPMIWHAIRALAEHPAIHRVTVVISAEDAWWDSYDWSGFDNLTVLRRGGATRAETVLNGLAAMTGSVAAGDWVLVHDGARPCLTRELLDHLLAELADDPVGGILAAPVADTLKRSDAQGRISETVSRVGLWGAQTPQMFRYAMLRQALELAGTQVTDEASALEYLGHQPRLVESDPGNLKVTYPRDLLLARLLLGP